MKTFGLIICGVMISTTLISSGVKIGLTAEKPAYTQYSSAMDLGIHVGNGEDYKSSLPGLFKQSSTADAFDSDALEVGAFLGVLLSTLTGDSTDELSALGNFMIGIYAMYAINSMFTLMPELYYTGKGVSVKDFDQKLKLGYIMLPIVVLYNINSQFMAGLGPYFGFLLSAKDKGSGFNDDVKDFVSGFDFGIKIAALYRATSYLTVSLAFSKGFSNIQSSDSFDQFNQAFMLAVYYNLTDVVNR